MTTEAQVQANRANAQKSTGPRSPAGKAAVSENAVKHGLSGRRDVIKGEDQDQFDRHREALLKELRPDGAVETMLAERVVSLSWRLERVGHMQNEVFDALLTDQATPLARLARSLIPGKAAEDDGLDLGRAVIKDFANSRVLDRLLMYERRMENSLLKTLNDLQLRRLRIREYISRHMDEIGGPQSGSWKCEVARLKSDGLDTESSELQTPHFKLQTSSATPDGVATNVPNEADADRMSATREAQYSRLPSFQDSSGAPDGLAGPEPSCKTKPICLGANDGQVSAGAGVREDWAADGGEATKPICAGSGPKVDLPSVPEGVLLSEAMGR